MERVKAGRYGVVLMDLHMPGGDGLEATREIRSVLGGRFERLPIIVVSASTRMAEPQEIEAAGFTDFVGKPVNPDVLFAKISPYRPSA